MLFDITIFNLLLSLDNERVLKQVYYSPFVNLIINQKEVHNNDQRIGIKEADDKYKCGSFLCQSLSILPLPQVKAVDISGRIIYVAENGSDYTGNGSSGSPYRSIKKAADEATAGTTVLIRPGTYIEEDIKPKESGKADAMIVFRPENTSDIWDWRTLLRSFTAWRNSRTPVRK